MKRNIVFITPAFLVGANQGKAELRAPSIRGELRWWFRVLGGSPAQEKSVFGGVHNGVAASKVVVRVKDVKPIHGQLPRPCHAQMSDLGYLYFFATVSGESKGIRIGRDAFFMPGTQFTWVSSERRALTKDEQELFARTCDVFTRLGSLGLRGTRGCGAMVEVDSALSRTQFADWLTTLPSNLYVRLAKNATFDSWEKCQAELGAFLREARKAAKLSGKEPSALGYSQGKKRESSALRLRPVKVDEGFLPVVIYTDVACRQTSIADQFCSATKPIH